MFYKKVISFKDTIKSDSRYQNLLRKITLINKYNLLPAEKQKEIESWLEEYKINGDKEVLGVIEGIINPVWREYLLDIISDLGLENCSRLIEKITVMCSLSQPGSLHVNTLGEHVRKTVENLEINTGYNDRERRLIKLAALLHDIGKIDAPRLDGKGILIKLFPDHPSVSVEIITEFIHELGLTSEEEEILKILIFSHNELSPLAEDYFECKGDVDAIMEKRLKDFIQMIPNMKVLNMLFMLVKADIKSVNPYLYEASRMQSKLQQLKTWELEDRIEKRGDIKPSFVATSIIEFDADPERSKYLVSVKRQILYDLAADHYTRIKFRLPLPPKIITMKGHDIEDLFEDLPVNFDVDDYLERLADALSKNEGYVYITVEKIYADGIRSRGLIAGDSWTRQRIIVGTVGRSLYLPEDRVVCRVRVDSQEIMPRLTGPKNEFQGVVVFTSLNIPADRVEIVN